MLHELSAGADDLLDMLGDVLDYSSLEAGQLHIEEAPFDLRATIARVAQAGEARARAKGLDFVCTVEDDVPAEVAGDARRLAQILAHLIINAVKYTVTGTVRLQVRRVGGDAARPTLSFAVSDTGIGIPAQRLGEVFQPFAHADGPGAGQQSGSGLGLAICRRLAALMQGVLAVQSEPARGSVFTLMLSLPRA
jgi:signal transduction histidine kinase